MVEGVNTLGKILIVTGLLILFIGFVYVLSARIKIPFVGRLPGDIVIQKKNFSFYFPFTTCLLISAIVSLILYWTLRK
ncbi:MAG: DUF2905 domain-containing protein [Candidatus Omnitrophota bacterium]|nr:MAG: DUF2905 domain-containing protein [Candidatus Omnitrophota bacterium]